MTILETKPFASLGDIFSSPPLVSCWIEDFVTLNEIGS
jgi:hypothetical protein